MDAPKNRSEEASRGKAWERYWLPGAGPGEALGNDDSALILKEFWVSSLKGPMAVMTHCAVADLGCGAGVVAETVLKTGLAAAKSDLQLYLFDYAGSAVRNAAMRIGDRARPVCADLAALPVHDRVFDLVLSQYGLEYAGLSAFDEAARTVAQAGAIIALVHDAGGGVAGECRGNLELFRRVLSIDLAGRAREAFDAAFAADRNPRLRRDHASAHGRLEAALRAFDQATPAENATVAAAFLRRFRSDLAQMYNRRRAYAADDISDWLSGVADEIAAYTERMAAMSAAALDAPGINEAAARIGACGCAVDPPQQLKKSPGGASLGWVLRARKTA